MTMTVKFDNINVEINNETVQKQIKNFILKAANHTKNHSAWTDDEDRQLAELCANGSRVAEIAKTMKRTDAAINTRVSILGLKREKQEETINL